MKSSDRTDELFYSWVQWLHSSGSPGQTCPMFSDFVRTGSYSSGNGPIVDSIESRIDCIVNALAEDEPKKIRVLKLHFGVYLERDSLRVKDKARSLGLGLKTYYKYLNWSKDSVIKKLYGE